MLIHIQRISIKMTIQLCKGLILHAVRNKCKPHDSFSSFVLLYSTSEAKPTSEKNHIFDLLRGHQISSETASTVASELSDLKSPEKCDSILSFLKENGFSKSHLEKLLISKPRLLVGSLDNTIKPKIKIFQDLGFSTPDIANIISYDPLILSRSFDNRVVPSIMVLKNVLGSMSEVAKLITKPARGLFLRYDLEKNMLPNIEILRNCGISRDRIIRSMFSVPRFLLVKPERMKELVENADKLGCDRNSMMFLYSIRTMASMSSTSWELKWELFQNLGISENKVLWIFHRKPQVFAISNRKIKEVVKVLLDTGKYDMEYISDEPDVFICSIEKRLKPRLHVLEILETRNLLKQRPRLSTVYKCSNGKFFQWFISPYLDEVSELKLLYENVWPNVISKSDKSIVRRRCCRFL